MRPLNAKIRPRCSSQVPTSSTSVTPRLSSPVQCSPVWYQSTKARTNRYITARLCQGQKIHRASRRHSPLLCPKRRQHHARRTKFHRRRASQSYGRYTGTN
jgi:hypothetical protein